MERLSGRFDNVRPFDDERERAGDVNVAVRIARDHIDWWRSAGRQDVASELGVPAEQVEELCGQSPLHTRSKCGTLVPIANVKV